MAVIFEDDEWVHESDMSVPFFCTKKYKLGRVSASQVQKLRNHLLHVSSAV